MLHILRILDESKHFIVVVVSREGSLLLNDADECLERGFCFISSDSNGTVVLRKLEGADMKWLRRHLVPKPKTPPKQTWAERMFGK